MTSIHETRHEEIQKIKTAYEKSKTNQSESSTNDTQLKDFQNQVEKTITRRFEILCNLYLEQIKFWGNFAQESIGAQQEYLAKMGLKIDAQPKFKEIGEAWNNALRNGYSSNTGYLEVILEMLHQNTKVTNLNMKGFAKIMQANNTWWLPPSQN